MGGAPPSTTDICDTNAEKIASGEVRILDPVFQSYGQRPAFSGPIVTVKTFEDNKLTRELVKSNGEGRVLVIDGGGGNRTALMGGKLVHAAHDNGWAGIVISGYIRDVDEINESDIGVRAFGLYPLRPAKKGVGEKHVPVYVAGTLIHEANGAPSTNLIPQRNSFGAGLNLKILSHRNSILLSLSPAAGR